MSAETAPDDTLRLPPEALIALAPDSWTAPFWEAAAEHRLIVPRCTRCGTDRFPPSPFCWNCQAQAVDWVERPGRGTVYSYTVVWHPVLPDLADSVPYAPAVVDLDETDGVRVVGALTGARARDVAVGLDVTLEWRDVHDGVTVPLWRPT